MSNHDFAARKFVVCVQNDEYPASLEVREVRKLYRALPDRDAAAQGQLRVIDESGEDYLYPVGYFASVELSAPVEAALLKAS
jgi:hypothetical protein